MPDERWQFWIDVGGTFTDCVARRPDGHKIRRKVLSSAVVKGIVGEASTADCLVNRSQREPLVDNFWRGYKLRLLNEQGQVDDEAQICGSQSGAGESIRLEAGLDRVPRHGQGFEIVSPEGAPLLAIRLFLGLRLDEPIPPCVVRLGTTRGTNALLTRRGARVGFITSRGFADVLTIGYQDRPRLFDLVIRKHAPLYETVIEVDERIAADGSILKAVDELTLRSQLLDLKGRGIESLAICLLNAYREPVHELVIERTAREVGFDEISVSHRVSPLMKIVPRGDTTVVDAYLNPVLRKYIEQLRSSLPGSDLRLMTSAGGLLSPQAFTGKDSILSGPAGGVVGFSKVAQAAGFERAIGFDMGGTSTDVSRFSGQYEHEFETQKAGVRIVAPMLSIETVAAGGGSVCRFDGVKLVVGPESAGADPGPACYGRGGPLTVTDCNVFLGRLPADRFPFALDQTAIDDRLKSIATEIEAGGGERTNRHALADGFLRIANTHMAAAIRSISIAKGYDPREYVLVPFGAAGPQHACAVARELGIQQILIPPGAGVLSAEGIGQSDISRIATAAVYGSYAQLSDDSLRDLFARLETEARAAVAGEGVPPDQVRTRRSLELRYQGVDATLTIDQPADDDFAAAFEAAHRQRYGYVQQGRGVEAVAARVEAVGVGEVGSRFTPPRSLQQAKPQSQHEIYLSGERQSVNVFDGATLREPVSDGYDASQVQGPAIIVDELTTTVVDPGWEAIADRRGYLLTDKGSARAHHDASTSAAVADPVMLEIFNNHFTAIATQMGIALRNTASSVNVKERLDFSCALFTGDGDLVVNAPHIPVHLGAMGETVRQIIVDNPTMRPGDVFATNDPYRGGSHLPDVTVVTPVFFDSHADSPARPNFFTASRAHHAEIGGISPGSMPPFSRSLAEEGVLIRNFKLVDAGQSRLDALAELLTNAPWPSRAVTDNLADIAAQMAANQQGANDLQRLVEQHSLRVVQIYMKSIQTAAEQKMRSALARRTPGRSTFTDYLDDGTAICVAIDIHGDTATIDFTGTGEVLSSNLNANRAIVTAAVLYCLRLLIGEDIPLNQGVLAPIQLILPECFLNPPANDSPELCPAVVGGNVETSQRVVDVLLGALGLAAASQGTMNNVLFGDATFGYYETICGGSGATATADGADAVHTHMTNTRLTDPEVLEKRFPVRVREFAVREESGGNGEQRGGNGVRRSLEFLKPVKLSLLTQRRGPYAPYGVAGGEPGQLGRNSITRADGSVERLPAQVQIDAEAGDVLTVETPGGGGWGQPPPMAQP
jgi:5-oxoprolinase (ATP-hydrolysing)